jgi:hypothetical protein
MNVRSDRGSEGTAGRRPAADANASAGNHGTRQNGATMPERLTRRDARRIEAYTHETIQSLSYAEKQTPFRKNKNSKNFRNAYYLSEKYTTIFFSLFYAVTTTTRQRQQP